MSAEWYLISNPYYTEGTETDDFNYNSQTGLADILADTPLKDDITLCKGNYDYTTNTFETEFETSGIIQGNSPDTQTKGWERQLLTELNTLSDYKYVKANGSLWLIMTKPANNKFYEKVVLYMVNYILKWQDDDYNIVYQPSNIQNASQYNSGEEGNKTVMIGYNQLMVYTSMDDNSIKLNREKRMFIDYNSVVPIAYRITRVDSVSYSYMSSRVMNIVVTEDQTNPVADRTDLMLCDYKEPDIQPITAIEITYRGNAQVVCGGSAKTFSATSEYPIVLWEVIAVSPYNDSIIITPNLNDMSKCKVKCVNNDLLVGTTFRLECTDDRGNTGEVLVDVVGGV